MLSSLQKLRETFSLLYGKDADDFLDFWLGSNRHNISNKESEPMPRESYYRNYADEIKKERKKEERAKRKKILAEKRSSETFLLDLFKEVENKDKSKEEIEQMNHHDEMVVHINKIRDYYVPLSKNYLEELQNNLGPSVKVLLCDHCYGSRILIKRNKHNLVCSVARCQICTRGIQIVPADVYEREHKEKMDLNLKENLDKLEKSDKIILDKALKDKVNEAFSEKETDKK